MLIRRGYEVFLIPMERVLNFFQDRLNFFYAANICKEVLTEWQAQDKNIFCIFSYSRAKSALLIYSILVFIATGHQQHYFIPSF